MTNILTYNINPDKFEYQCTGLLNLEKEISSISKKPMYDEYVKDGKLRYPFVSTALHWAFYNRLNLNILTDDTYYGQFDVEFYRNRIGKYDLHKVRQLTFIFLLSVPLEQLKENFDVGSWRTATTPHKFDMATSNCHGEHLRKEGVYRLAFGYVLPEGLCIEKEEDNPDYQNDPIIQMLRTKPMESM